MPDPVIYQNPLTGTRWAATGDNITLLLSWGWEPVEADAGTLAISLDATLADAIDDEGSATRAEIESLFPTITGATGAPAVSVTDYGAVGNGAADDTAAFAAALAANTDVLAPALSYKVTSVTVPAGKTLRGMAGATLVASASATGLTLIDLGAGAILDGFAVDGSTDPAYFVNAGSGASVLRCSFSDSTGYGVHTSGATDVTIKDCTFTQVDGYAALIENASHRVRFVGNRVTHTTPTKGQGITVKDATHDAVITGNQVDALGTIGLELQDASDRGTITANVVTGVGIGVSLSSASGCTVTGNTLSGCTTYGIEAAEATTDSTITGNTALDCQIGIAVTSSSSGTPPRNVTVSGNIVRDSVGSGIAVQHGNGLVITGNSVDSPGGHGIEYGGVIVGLLIGSNHIYRSAAPTSGSDGISGTADDVIITSNLIDYSGLSSAVGFGLLIYGSTNASLFGNMIKGPISKAIAITAACDRVLVVGNKTQGTTENSVWTGSTPGDNPHVTVEMHYMVLTGGVGLDMSGVTYPHTGTVYNADTNVLATAVEQLTSPLNLANQSTTTTAPAAGGVALPATATGFVTVTINGTARKIAYY